MRKRAGTATAARSPPAKRRAGSSSSGPAKKATSQKPEAADTANAEGAPRKGAKATPSKGTEKKLKGKASAPPRAQKALSMDLDLDEDGLEVVQSVDEQHSNDEEGDEADGEDDEDESGMPEIDAEVELGTCENFSF